ncbi:hypothetical protein GCM10011445_16280 [Pseudocitrobacter faecalis]|nr:hypothetical protein GCM10011445_16280 [Pseudocitrobacter faecalis]
MYMANLQERYAGLLNRGLVKVKRCARPLSFLNEFTHDFGEYDAGGKACGGQFVIR